mgnify:CR=1 FL=1
MSDTSNTKTVKNPTQASNKGFVVAAILVVLALVGGLLAYVKFAPTQTDSALSNFDKDDVNMTLTYEDGVVTLENNPKDNAKTISIYEDFSCSYCAKLAQQDDESLKNAVESGDIILKIRTMNFLDRGEISNSTKVFAPALAMAQEGDAEQYWNYRKLNFFEFETVSGLIGEDAEFEDNVSSKLGFDAEYLGKARDEDALNEANAEAEKNIKSLEELAGEVSSPRVFWDEEEIDVQTPGWVEMIAQAPESTLSESQEAEQE